MQFLGREAQQVLQVAHEAVHVPLPRRLVDDILVVVIAQTPAELLVVHLGLVFPLSPPAGHLWRGWERVPFNSAIEKKHTCLPRPGKNHRN